MDQQRSLPVPEGLSGARVDVGVARLLGLSRTFATTIVEQGGVSVDGVIVGKSDRLHANSWLTVAWQTPRVLSVESVVIPGMNIIHDDEDIVVVDKPAGVAAHPSLGWTGPTVVGGLAAAGFRISTSGAAERQGVVHRLDAGTSGLMVVAKSERAYTELKRQFHDREVTKIYHTVVQGHPDPLRGTIDAPVGRHPHSEWRFAVTADGRHAVTHYETVEAFVGASLLEIHLETGRTHQIRVHMAAQRHPCVGDLMYGADPVLAERLSVTRQWLHARELTLRHPGSGEWVSFHSEYPGDLANALTMLRNGS
ncbi:MAG: RNA pseudouridine synthase [Candidatus Lumbricidophila eiseniae]|uniref:Pseudouridine synthase n=1 Tax=Candidatus Lumbricidiphila eiseniae TaxID=1969409 RepID=A0A2A6FP05_9MICO|nr:MAG: RNA pseudouridine synthase [Candidatus Lumbricidophila eiseniae]